MFNSASMPTLDLNDLAGQLDASLSSFSQQVNQSAARDADNNIICRHVLTSLTKLVKHQHLLVCQLKSECENSRWVKQSVRKSNISFLRAIFKPSSIHFDITEILRDVTSRKIINNEIINNFTEIDNLILVIRKDIPKSDRQAFTETTQELRASLALLQDHYKQLYQTIVTIYNTAMESVNRLEKKKGHPVNNLEPVNEQLRLMS